MQNVLMRSELELRGPRNGLRFPSCEASSVRFSVMLRAESDGDDETGRRVHRRRFSGRSGEGGAPREDVM
eukprot:12734558-Alexandrium_andersonii.AAC.1